MQDEEEHMKTRATQQRGGGREGHSAGMTGRQERPLTESRSQLRGVGDAISSLLQPLARRWDAFRTPGTLRTGPKSRRGLTAAAATISVIVCLLGSAGPAAADLPVNNHAESSTTPIDAMKLSVNQFAQSFTTGSNATGYQLESISLQFATGRRYESDPVYVSVWPDNGNNRPASSGQIAQLAINHYGEGPVAGSNKYKVISRTMLGGPRLASVRLGPNTKYWVHIWAGEQATTAQLHRTTASRQDGKPGWSIGNTRLVAPEGGTAADYVGYPDALKMKVEGRIRGLSDLVIQPRTTATEGVDDTADFDVRLDPASPVTVTVDYATKDQTAFAPADFEATSGTLTFQPGDTVKTVSVPIVDDDDLAESDEEFNLELSNPSGATISLATGVATIVNNTTAKISVSDATATEGIDATMDFVVSLNGAAASTITVNASTSGGLEATEGADYIVKLQKLTFNPGQNREGLLGSNRRRHRRRRRRALRGFPQQRDGGRRHCRCAWDRHHPQPRGSDGQLPERATGARR